MKKLLDSFLNYSCPMCKSNGVNSKLKPHHGTNILFRKYEIYKCSFCYCIYTKKDLEERYNPKIHSPPDLSND